MKNYYQILEINQDASAEDIKSSYKRLVNIFHPDRAVNDIQKEYFEEKLKDLNEAFSHLKDPNKRVEHDANLTVIEVSPSVLSFGSLTVGDIAQNFFVVNFTGKFREINFSRYPENIFGIGNVESIGDQVTKQTFPLQVEVIAETIGLAPGKTYMGTITVQIDDFEAKVSLFLKTSIEKLSPEEQRRRLREEQKRREQAEAERRHDKDMRSLNITDDERMILYLLEKGLSDVEIANRIKISDPFYSELWARGFLYIGRITEMLMKKFEAKNVAELIRYAKKYGHFR